MITPEFGHYGYVVLLQRDRGDELTIRTVPFGLFQTSKEAHEWAETELTVQDDESYTVNYVRHVAG